MLGGLVYSVEKKDDSKCIGYFGNAFVCDERIPRLYTCDIMDVQFLAIWV